VSEPLDAARGPQQRRAAVQSILGNGGRLLGLNWVETGLSIAYFAVMARFLGPVLYGHWAYGVAAYTLVVGITGLSFDALIILRLGRDKQDGGDFLGLVLTLRLMLLIGGAIGLAGYALVAEPDLFSRLILLLFIPALLGRGVALGARICFVAYERMADYAKFVALFRSAEAGCGVAYLAAGGGLIGIVVLHALFWVGEGGFGLWRIRTRLSRYVLRFEWRPATELLGQVAVLGLSTAGFTWLATGPITMLRHSMVGMAQLGQFAVVSSVSMMLVASAHAFFTAALPVLSRSSLQNGAGTAYGRTTAVVIVAAGAIAAGMGWLLGPPLVGLVLGARYAAVGAMLVPFLIIGALILAPIGYEQALLVAGRRGIIAFTYVAGGAWLAATFLPAVTAWGIDGAVASTGAAWLVRAVLLIGVGEAFAFGPAGARHPEQSRGRKEKPEGGGFSHVTGKTGAALEVDSVDA
jgi:O-antigen/teichoic acid export membrane protein